MPEETSSGQKKINFAVTAERRAEGLPSHNVVPVRRGRSIRLTNGDIGVFRLHYSADPRRALQKNPDALGIDALRTRETLGATVAFAETKSSWTQSGYLVLSWRQKHLEDKMFWKIHFRLRSGVSGRQPERCRSQEANYTNNREKAVLELAFPSDQTI